jgi:hypothetical protein
MSAPQHYLSTVPTADPLLFISAYETGEHMGPHRAYEIEELQVDQYVLNGVYEDMVSGEAWLGRIFTRADTQQQDVQPWPGPDAKMIPAPDGWLLRAVRFLGAYE